MVAYHLGGRLGHGMWSSVVGWNFGTDKIKVHSPDRTNAWYGMVMVTARPVWRERAN